MPAKVMIFSLTPLRCRTGFKKKKKKRHRDDGHYLVEGLVGAVDDGVHAQVCNVAVVPQVYFLVDILAHGELGRLLLASTGRLALLLCLCQRWSKLHARSPRTPSCYYPSSVTTNRPRIL